MTADMTVRECQTRGVGSPVAGGKEALAGRRDGVGTNPPRVGLFTGVLADSITFAVHFCNDELASEDCAVTHSTCSSTVSAERRRQGLAVALDVIKSDLCGVDVFLSEVRDVAYGRCFSHVFTSSRRDSVIIHCDTGKVHSK